MMENSAIATCPAMPVLLKNHSSTTIGRASRRRARARCRRGKSAGERERRESERARGAPLHPSPLSPPLPSSPQSFLSWDRARGVRGREERRASAAAAAAMKKRGGRKGPFIRSLARGDAAHGSQRHGGTLPDGSTKEQLGFILRLNLSLFSSCIGTLQYML